VVIAGKHLCGGATDLALRCAVKTLRCTVDKQSEEEMRGEQVMLLAYVILYFLDIRKGDTQCVCEIVELRKESRGSRGREAS
jgi:hypothetical protein